MGSFAPSSLQKEYDHDFTQQEVLPSKMDGEAGSSMD